MAQGEHYWILAKGREAWNNWRNENPEITPMLRGENLSMWDLRGVNLDGAYLHSAILQRTKFCSASMRDAQLRNCDLLETDFTDADLTGTHFNNSHAHQTKFVNANLTKCHFDFGRLDGVIFDRAFLIDADLSVTQIVRSRFNKANLKNARVGWTEFNDVDLSEVDGLETVRHIGPTSIGIDTIFRSNGRINDQFLRKCGIPEVFIGEIPALIGAQQPIRLYSCFISYSHRDEEFANRLYNRMLMDNMRVWYAPEEMKGGLKLHEQVYNAIQLFDKLLIILSDNSLRSEWVMSEIRRALKTGREENRRKLFPIRVVDFETIKKWECFDAESGKDLAIEVREYFIPDFSNWTDTQSFEESYNRFLRDLKADIL